MYFFSANTQYITPWTNSYPIPCGAFRQGQCGELMSGNQSGHWHSHMNFLDVSGWSRDRNLFTFVELLTIPWPELLWPEISYELKNSPYRLHLGAWHTLAAMFSAVFDWLLQTNCVLDMGGGGGGGLSLAVVSTRNCQAQLTWDEISQNPYINIIIGLP